MLVPPRVGEMAAYASLRQDSLGRSSVERRPSRFFRRSLQRLGHFVDQRQGHGHTLSRHPLGSTFDSSDTSSSDAPTESDFGEVQSVTTFDSSETLNDDVLDDELCRPEEKDGLLFVNAEAFPHSISGKKAKLAFTSSLQKNGNMSQVDIDSRYVETPLCHERKGLIELPKLVRKEIWHKAIVHNQKLLICSC